LHLNIDGRRVAVTETILFLLLVAIGTLVQSITGFAMGLIIMGGVTALGLAEIAFSAAVVSLISMVNAVVALRHTYRYVDRIFWRNLVMGLVPFTIAGLALLHILSTGFTEGLKVLLGIVIILAGGLLMAQPHPFGHSSGRFSTIATGSAGGLVTGLYGAGGAPLAWFMYRQPLDVNVIRATLLATFLVSTAGRSAFVTVSGQLTSEIVLTALLSIPIVVVVTLMSRRIAPFVPDKLLRRFVFLLLILLGASLILRPIYR
ncbi:MAG: sulfite exporter TauE/SafE family protein, partial [Pseudomonadales bacterium]